MSTCALKWRITLDYNKVERNDSSSKAPSIKVVVWKL